MVEHLVTGLEPIRQRREAALAKPGYIEDVLEEGNRRAREVTRATMADARVAAGLPNPS
jgi:hypothetical protein